jgi:cytochrome c oxidase cbb3-type subunit 2
MEFFDNHKKLFSTALALFVFLTIIVALMPAINNQNNNAPLPNAEPLSEAALEGKKSFISNGCVACHTQQVRNVDMDKIWGDRPGIAADYASIGRTDLWRNTATLMGTERTGPDLTNVGQRQGSLTWNLVHLYQPRALVKTSIMPAYPWLFEVKKELDKDDVEVNVPNEFKANADDKIVASQEALNLVAYLQSMKQVQLPSGINKTDFLYKKVNKNDVTKSESNEKKLPDGKLLYANNCMTCHQANGEGLPGAFPPLKGSKIVQDDNIEVFVKIIMLGYDARPEYAVMNAVGTDNNLSAEDVTAIINHERTSWGNNAKVVDVEEVRKVIENINANAKK